MLVKDLMTPGLKVITVHPNDSVSKVAEIIHTHHFTGVPVVGDNNEVVGMIAERDFITADSQLYLPTYIKVLSELDYSKAAEKTGVPYAAKQIMSATAADIMNRKIPFAHPEMTLEQLAVLFAERRINPIPVTDSKNQLLGIISRSDLIKLFSPQELTSSYVAERRSDRPIDAQASFLFGDLNKRFSKVANARANIWATALIVILILAGIFGGLYAWVFRSAIF